MNAPKSPIDDNDHSAKAESVLQKFLLLSLDLVCITEENGYFHQLNPSWEKVLGWTASELLHRCWMELVHPDDVEVTLNIERQCLQQDLVEYENRYRHKDGSYRWLSWRVSRTEDGLCYRVAKEITATKATENSQHEGSVPTLGDRLEFEKLLATLSTEFIRLSSEEIDGEINRALQIIGEFAGCDRTFVVLFGDGVSGVAPDSVAVPTLEASELAGAGTRAPDGKLGSLTYEWYTESVGPLPKEWQQISTESFPWWMTKMQRFEVIQASTLAELPPEASNERAAIASVGTKSIIAVPLVSGKSAIGYISCSAIREEKTWSEDVVALLRFVGEIFANALNRKQVELKLRESERRFRAVFKQTFQLSSLLRLDGTVLEDNQTAMDVCQLERSDVVGHPFWELKCWTISPETQERLRTSIAEAAAGNVVRYEADILAPDNTVITIDFSLKPMKDEAGQVELLIAEGRDLMERKRIESALRESEQWFRCLSNCSPVGIFLTDVEGRCTYANPRLLAITGLRFEEILGEGWARVVHRDDREWVFAEWSEYAPQGQECYQEYRFQISGGIVRWVQVRTSPMRDDRGELIGHVGTVEDISERKQSEEALRESEQRFRFMANTAPVLIWMSGIDKLCNYFNKRWLDFTGRTLAQEMGNGWLEGVHPEDGQRSFDIYITAFDARQEFELEYRLRRFDGEYRWVLDRGVPRFTPDGSFVGYIGSCIDISDRKWAEAELQKAYQQLTLVVDNSPLAIVEWDSEFRLQRWSKQAEKIFGWKVTELLNKHPWDWRFVYDEDAQRVNNILDRLVDGTLQRTVDENRNYTKDGRIVACEWYNSVLLDESGNLLSILSLVLDVTERKQAEAALQQVMTELETRVEQRTAELQHTNEQLSAEIAERQRTEAALRQSEEQFRQVFDEAPIAMALTGTDRRFFRVNQALLEMLGHSESEFMCLRCEDITHPEDWEQILPYIEQIRKGEIDRFQIEERFLKKNQEIVWVNLTLIALRDQSGAILYTLAMVEDITERKQAEAEILQALERERELSELRSGFVSLVSHEFRTPLTTIQSSAELLERYNHKLSDEKKQNHHRRIQNAVQRMTQLLEDVLTIGKAEAGKLQFTASPMDLVAFCRDLVESLQMSVQRQHQLNFVVVGNGSQAQMDEKLLGHILTNLITNAIKYSPDGGTVQFDLVCNPESAVFRIQDSGIGIPPEDLESLFESFGRASNVGTIPGTGLGLAIVKRCVDLHGGKITVESEVGVGTTFTVTLPLKSQSSTDELAYREE